MIEQVESLSLIQAEAVPRSARAETGPVYLSDDERALVSRAQAGNPRALREIYQRYQAQVRGHLFRLLGPDADLDDVVQVVFTSAFKALSQFHGNSTLSTWLYRITANRTHNMLRQRFRRDRVKSALAWFQASRGGPGETRVEARDEASRILNRLTPELRQVFVLYHYEGLTLQEIGQVLDKPISTVGDRLTRARKSLRELASA